MGFCRVSSVARNPNPSSSIIMALARASLMIFLLITVLANLRVANCEAKEFDWSDLGVSLQSAPKSSLSSSQAQNLHILVSPQRRMTKNYEFDYNATASQPPVASQGETSYVIPGSGGSAPTYLTQAVSPTHSAHSSAYSALSASLASLKNRLSARGVSLGSSLSESNVSNLYPTSGSSSYGSSLMLDPQPMPQTQPQAQPTYLSVASQPEPTSVYASAHNQSTDNKTIVLAIPAKINFLTDGRSSGSKLQMQQHQQQIQPQAQQQPQQLAVLQSAGVQAGGAHYQTSGPQYQTSGPQYQTGGAQYQAAEQQIGILNPQDGSIKQTGQVVSQSGGQEQEHHQYVIVNQAPPQAEQPQQMVAPNTAQVQQAQNPVYYPVQQNSQMGSYAMKYIPTYQQVPAQQQPAQKMYSTAVEHSGPTMEQAEPAGRYNTCLDTCNSADPKWRKYTISKYKYCCSRSPQYDTQYDAPSADKVGETAIKYADDAYYNYLYRRTRARRSKKSRASRYYRHSSASASSSPSASEDDSADSGNAQDAVRPSSGRGYYDAPYPKHYKSRQPQSAEAAAPQDSAEQSPASGGKYKSERSYRRGRSREYDTPAEPQPSHETSEEDTAYNQRDTTRGYGSGEYSVDYGRYSGDSRALPEPEEEQKGANYDSEATESDLGKTSADGSDYPTALDQPSEVSQHDDTEQDTGAVSGGTSGYNKYTGRRRKHSRASKAYRRSQSQSSKDSKYYARKQGRKSRYNSKVSDYQPASQANATDYEAALPGDQYHDQANNEEEQSYQKDAGAGQEATSGEQGENVSLTGKTTYKQNLNDSTVAHLSKTTMHLKEILSLLEKKAQLRANETASLASQPAATSTPAPTTTTSIYSSPLFASPFNSPSLASSFSNDYLSSELSLKSPYRLESPSFSSALSSSGLSPYGSLSSDPYSPLNGYVPPSHYGSMAQVKNLPTPHGSHGRKRRVNKNHMNRYNSMMLQKPHGHLGSPSASLLQAAAGKNSLLNNPYYSALQYPYWYTRGSSPSVTNSYPYKNIHKPSYQSLLGGTVSSKLAAAAAASSSLYSDDSRYHGLQGYDPISSSSLRPSSTMRLRSKPFVLQPQVLPIYTRHSILTSPLDVKAAAA